MKITLLWVGKTKSQNMLSLIQDYERRIRPFCELLIREIKPVTESDPARVVAEESEKLLAKVQSDHYLIALDSRGKGLTTERFTNLIAARREHSLKNLVFLIGGHWGLSANIKSRANQLLSLSQMTLNHEMARLILMEQIYRAFTLIHHLPYHK